MIILSLFSSYFLSLHDKTVLIANLILELEVVLNIFSNACSPISPQALIVETINYLSKLPSFNKFIKIGRPPPFQIREYILFRAAKELILFLGSPVLISLRSEGIMTESYISSVYANLFIINLGISLKSLFAISTRA